MITRVEMRTEDVELLGDLPDGLPPDLRDGEVSIEEHDLFQIEGPDGVKRTFHSLDEMPPDIRAGFEQDLKEAGKGRRSSLNSAASGDGSASHVKTPAELRQELAKMASEHKEGRSFLFELEGPDGRKQTYHSLEELPPHARALYDKLMRVKAEAEGPAGNTKSRHD